MKTICLFLLICGFSQMGNAQIQNPVKWSYASKKIDKTTAIIFIKATIDDGWHIYSTSQKSGGPTKTTFTFKPNTDYKLLGKVTEPTAVIKFEKAFGINVRYFENSVVFEQKIALNVPSPTIQGKINFMVCNVQKCISPDDVEFTLSVR